MKKLQILILGIVLLFGAYVAQAQTDTTQNITQAGNYRITVRGADGGNSGFESGGSGASIAATFVLQAGDVLTRVTGLAGEYGDFSSGGGGGSAVILTRGGVSSLLLVAGAGGGADDFGGGGGGNSAQGSAGGGAGGLAGGGGGFNAAGGDGFCQFSPCAGQRAFGGKAGTLAGGGGGGLGYNSPSGGYGFGGGGGAATFNGGITTCGGGGGGFGGGFAGCGDNGSGSGGGGSSFVALSASNITRTNGVTGGGTSRNGLVSITFLPPTAATVSISGRVTTATGRGIMNVRLTLTDSNGQVRTTGTTSFGYYRFDDVQAGQTVIITAKAKRFTFTQSSVVRTTNESVTDADFISEQ